MGWPLPCWGQTPGLGHFLISTPRPWPHRWGQVISSGTLWFHHLLWLSLLCFHHPCDLPLSDTEWPVLKLGLNLVFHCPHSNEFRIRHDLEASFRRLHLHAFFCGKESSPTSDDPFSHRQRSTSSWTPQDGHVSSLNLIISNCWWDSNWIDCSTPPTYSNLTTFEPSRTAYHAKTCQILALPLSAWSPFHPLWIFFCDLSSCCYWMRRHKDLATWRNPYYAFTHLYGQAFGGLILFYCNHS